MDASRIPILQELFIEEAIFAEVLTEIQEDAFALAARDPLLDKPEHAILKQALITKWHGKLKLARTG